jgi:sec-independent protein translocase protein TatA
MPLGWPELIVILVIVLLVFGPKRLPMLGRQLGGGMREFKDSITGKSKGGEDDDDDREEPVRSLESSAAANDAVPSGETTAPVAAERRDPAPPAA